ncbi:hypothetical protein B0H13DRAFT_2503322 [Mycena leptocephala]|nr:hypothetical protein B0H13DRAFT_2503322 [Mycena leptocephala]
MQSLPNCSNPSHHLVALSPHNDTDSNSNSPILPPAIALSSPTCPKTSFVCGPKSSMPKVPVKDVSICLRWVVGPASAVHLLLLPPLLALPTHFCLPLLRLYLPPLLHGVGSPFTSFLPSHPTRAPELVETTHLYLKGPGDLALLVYSIFLFSFLRLMLSVLMPVWKWGIRNAGKYTLSTTPVSSAVNPLTAHFWLDYPPNRLSGPMEILFEPDRVLVAAGVGAFFLPHFFCSFSSTSLPFQSTYIRVRLLIYIRVGFSFMSAVVDGVTMEFGVDLREAGFLGVHDWDCNVHASSHIRIGGLPRVWASVATPGLHWWLAYLLYSACSLIRRIGRVLFRLPKSRFIAHPLTRCTALLL